MRKQTMSNATRFLLSLFLYLCVLSDSVAALVLFVYVIRTRNLVFGLQLPNVLFMFSAD